MIKHKFLLCSSPPRPLHSHLWSLRYMRIISNSRPDSIDTSTKLTIEWSILSFIDFWDWSGFRNERSAPAWNRTLLPHIACYIRVYHSSIPWSKDFKIYFIAHNNNSKGKAVKQGHTCSMLWSMDWYMVSSCASQEISNLEVTWRWDSYTVS